MFEIEKKTLLNRILFLFTCYYFTYNRSDSISILIELTWKERFILKKKIFLFCERVFCE